MLRTAQSHVTFSVISIIVISVVLGLTSCIKPTTPLAPSSQPIRQTEIPIVLAKESSFLLVTKPELIKSMPTITSTEMLTETFVLLRESEVPQELTNSLDLTGVITTLVMIPSDRFTELAMIPDQALMVVPNDKLKSGQPITQTVGSMTLDQQIIFPQANRLLLQIKQESLQALRQPAPESEKLELIFKLVGSDQQITLSFSGGATDPTDGITVQCNFRVWEWCMY